jgi:hypothetical protein
MRETGLPTVPDQGIIFDHEGLPRDTRPEQQLKRLSIPPVSGRDWKGKEGKKGGAVGKEDPVENSKGLPKGNQGPGGPGRQRNKDVPSESSDDDSGSPTDGDEDVDGKLFHVSGYDAVLGNIPRALAYSTPYVRASTLELDVYKGRGDPRPMKHLKAIHEKY